jgi:hypothetical protein
MKKFSISCSSGTERPYGERNSERFQTYLTFSQECAKASVPDICSIPIQANNAGADQGVSFDLNEHGCQNWQGVECEEKYSSYGERRKNGAK